MEARDQVDTGEDAPNVSEFPELTPSHWTASPWKLRGLAAAGEYQVGQ